jgi:L,D-transpeptidase ErfK/SrfK
MERTPGRRSKVRVAIPALLAIALAGCSARAPVPVDLTPPPPPPLERLTVVQVEIPKPKARPPVIGRMQSYRIRKGDTLLDVAREAGLGYHELQDANPAVDQWVPARDADVVVPTRWILPQSGYRGIVVNVPEMRLYLFPKGARPGQRVAVRTWPVSVGVEEAQSPVGRFAIRAKDKNPTWGVPESIYKIMEAPRRRVVPPGPDNPLGKYRLRLDHDLYAIHGTNNPWSIGRVSTNGCIRLYPEDLEVMYPLVPVGTTAEFVYEPVKIGEDGGEVYAEVHHDLYKRVRDLDKYAFELVRKAGLEGKVDRERLRQAVREQSGVPVVVTRRTTSQKS